MVRCLGEDVAHGASVLLGIVSHCFSEWCDGSDGSDGARGVSGDEPIGWRPFRVLPLYPSPSGELWTERALRSMVLWRMGSTLSTFLGGSTVSEHGRKPRTLSLT